MRITSKKLFFPLCISLSISCSVGGFFDAGKKKDDAPTEQSDEEGESAPEIYIPESLNDHEEDVELYKGATLISRSLNLLSS